MENSGKKGIIGWEDGNWKWNGICRDNYINNIKSNFIKKDWRREKEDRRGVVVMEK